MPSASLRHWQNDRMPRLQEIDIQCGLSLALAPPNPRLVEENLRGYVVLLSAHFQGFCRRAGASSSRSVASSYGVHTPGKVVVWMRKPLQRQDFEMRRPWVLP